MKVLGLITSVSNDIQIRHLQIQVGFNFFTYLLNPSAIEMTLLNNVKFKTFIVMFRCTQILVSMPPM